MSASRPEAKVKDSTSVGSRGVPERLSSLVSGLGFAGALALLVAQLTPLLRIVTVARHPTLVRTVQTGPHHGWALVPMAAIAIVVAALARRSAGRTAPVALAALGLVSLGVALIVDLPGVHATGIVGTPATGLQTAQAHAGVGLYLETLGGALLLLAGGIGSVASSGAEVGESRSLKPANRGATQRQQTRD